MSIIERQTIRLLFASGQYLKLYESQAHIINEILSIKTQKEFEDFFNEDVASMSRYFGYTMDLGTEKAFLLSLTMKRLPIRLGAT